MGLELLYMALQNQGKAQQSQPHGTATFLSSGTWTCPSGVSLLEVECWGGGGNGGDAYYEEPGAGGGGGGAYAKSINISVTAGNNYTVTVGGANQQSIFGNNLVKADCGTNGGLGYHGSGGNRVNCIGNATRTSGGDGYDGEGGAGGNGANGGAGGAGGAGFPEGGNGGAGTVPGGGGGGGGQGTGYDGSGGAGASGKIYLVW